MPFALTPGTRYDSDKASWPEMMRAMWREDALVFELFLSEPSQDEIAGIEAHRVEISLFDTHAECLTLCLRVPDGTGRDTIAWSDIPFSAHLHCPDGRIHGFEPETIGSTTKLAARVCLVDADTGILMAMAQGTLNSDWTKRWAYGVEDQWWLTFSQDAYDKARLKFHASRGDIKELAEGKEAVRSWLEAPEVEESSEEE